MILTEKQAVFMLIVLRDAVAISARCVGLGWSYDDKTMFNMLNDIMNQQSSVLVDIKQDGL